MVCGESTRKMDFVEGSLWKQKKTMTGFKWKKRWIRADKNRLIQWHSDQKPSDKVKPKHIYNLQKCTVREIRANKPYAFSVTDNTNGDAIIFAASKVAEYDTWLSVLMRDDISEDKPDIPATKLKSPTPPVKDEGPVPSFFTAHNVSRNLKNKEIKSMDFAEALKAAGLSLSSTETALALQTLQSPKGTIAESDFLKWLAKRDVSYGNDTSKNQPDQDNISDTGSKRSVETVDTKASSPKRRSKKPKGPTRILGQDEIMRLNHSGSYWLNIGESGLLAGIVDITRGDIQKTAEIIAPLCGKTPDIGSVLNEFSWPIEMGNPANKMGLWNSLYQDLIEEVSQIPLTNQTSDHFRELYSLISLQGLFLHYALTGSQLIVDTYTLPSSMKSSMNIISLSNPSDDSTQGEKNEELFYYNGLIFRLSGCCDQNDNDVTPTDLRFHSVLSNEEISHKLFGNELRGLYYTQSGLSSLNLSELETNEILRPTVLMTTLIDYCGFRFQIFAPIHIDEQYTLVYGYSTSENIFIDANPTVHTLIPMISKQLNLSLTRKRQFICPTILDEYDPTDLVQRPSEVLSKDLQFHIIEHNRVYLMNFMNFLPPDLPKELTTDILTKTLRPEYIHEYSEGSISSEIIRSDLENQLSGNNLNTTIGSDEDDGGGAGGGGGGGGGGSMENTPHGSMRPTIILKPLKPVLQWIRSASSLREDCIPDVVLKLDTLTCLPLDSYGLTRFLHSHGVNMRYLGDIYLRTKMPHIKDLILCEVVTRSCKTILNQSLKNISRLGRAQTVIAEQRKRSKVGNYIEHQGKVLHSKIQLVIDLFNLVLGYGSEAEEFWHTTLPSVVYYKFAITLPRFEDLSYYFHFPQLFHTLQQQTGYYFHSNKSYSLHHPSYHTPFHLNDLQHITPLYKYQLSLSGIFSTIEKSADGFLASKKYQDALNSYKLKLTFTNILSSNLQLVNNKLQHQQNQLIYLIALCYYFLERYTMASSLLKTSLEDFSQYHFSTISFLTLLMCIEFKLTNISLALSYYDTIQDKITYHYGSTHPLHYQIDILLSDLYFMEQMYSHAKVMLLVSLTKFELLLGRNHLLYGVVSYKLATIDLYLQQYPSSELSYHHALQLFHNLVDTSSGGGGVFQYELSLCYHGLSYIYNIYEDITKAIKYSLKSLSLTIIEDNYIAIDTVNTILHLGELYEKNNICYEAIQLYCDGWNIVWEYSNDYEIPKILLILIAKIVKGYLNSQMLSIRMLFDSIASEVHDVKQREWDIGCNYVIRQILEKTPLGYITELIEDLLKHSNPVFSVTSLGGQTNVIGVPCSNKKRGSSSGGSLSVIDLLESQQSFGGGGGGGGGSADLELSERVNTMLISKVSHDNVPFELQAAILLMLILELT